jgi:hypothetical protein
MANSLAVSWEPCEVWAASIPVPTAWLPMKTFGRLFLLSVSHGRMRICITRTAKPSSRTRRTERRRFRQREYAGFLYVALKRSRSDSEYANRCLQNVFWNFLYTRVYAAISWDRLHAYHGGLFSDHLFEEILNILETTDSRTKREFRVQVEEL